MLLEYCAPGDASTSDGPSSRTSCALRGLRWPGMPALLIRMVWLMEERLRKRWVWKRYRGRGNGWVGGRTKQLTCQLLHLPLRPEWLWDRRMWQPSSGEYQGTERVDHQSHSGCFLWLSLSYIWYFLWVIEGCQESILMDPECIYYWFSTGELQPELFAGLFWQCYNA